MTTTTINLVVPAGATFPFDFLAVESDGTTPMDLTGWTARMQVRPNFKKVGNALLEFTTTNTKLVITPLTGKIRLIIPATDTDSIPVDKDGRQLFYDLEIDNGSGVVNRPFQGIFTLTPQITI